MRHHGSEGAELTRQWQDRRIFLRWISPRRSEVEHAGPRDHNLRRRTVSASCVRVNVCVTLPALKSNTHFEAAWNPAGDSDAFTLRMVRARRFVGLGLSTRSSCLRLAPRAALSRSLSSVPLPSKGAGMSTMGLPETWQKHAFGSAMNIDVPVSSWKSMSSPSLVLPV